MPACPTTPGSGNRVTDVPTMQNHNTGDNQYIPTTRRTDAARAVERDRSGGARERKAERGCPGPTSSPVEQSAGDDKNPTDVMVCPACDNCQIQSRTGGWRCKRCGEEFVEPVRRPSMRPNHQSRTHGLAKRLAEMSVDEFDELTRGEEA